MILIVTEQADLTADLVIGEFERRGSCFARLNCERLLNDVHLTSGTVCESVLRDEAGQVFTLESVRSVWYRRPALPDVAPILSLPVARFVQRETWAHTMGVLLGLNAFWISNPTAIWRANHKAYQLSVAKNLNIRVPRTLITRSPEQALAFVTTSSNSIISKPVSYGSIEGTDPELAIYTTRLTPPFTLESFTGIQLSPVILQEEVPKKRDIRVTVVGNKVFAVGIESQVSSETEVDWRRPTQNPLEHVVMHLPAGVHDSLIKLVQALGLQYGAIDLIEKQDGEFVFLEVNPNGQWGWLQKQTGLNIAGAIADRLIVGE